MLLTGGCNLEANIFKIPHYSQPLFEGNFYYNTGINDEPQIAVVV